MLLHEWLERHQRAKPGLGRVFGRARYALDAARVISLEQLCARTADELLRFDHVGPATIAVLEDALAEDGLRLKDGR